MKVGDLHNKAMAGGVKTPGTLTAYVIISLLEAGKLNHKGFSIGPYAYLECLPDLNHLKTSALAR